MSGSELNDGPSTPRGGTEAGEPWSALSGPRYQTRRVRDATLQTFHREVSEGRQPQFSRDDLMALLEMARQGNATTQRNHGRVTADGGGGDGNANEIGRAHV